MTEEINRIQKISDIQLMKTLAKIDCQLVYIYIKNQIVLPPGELSCPVDTFDSSSQDNLQSTRASEVQVS